MENPESSKERTQASGGIAAASAAESLASRWQHWGVAVRAAEPGALVAEVPPANLLGVLGDAKNPDGPGYCRLVDLTALDHGVEASSARFELVYWLRRDGGGGSLRIRVALGTRLGTEPDAEPGTAPGAEPEARLEVDSIVRLWPSANWLEREVFDLFGITFRGHPDLRRLLLPSDFEGAPLRKDYPRQPNLPLPKTTEGTTERTTEATHSTEATEATPASQAPEAGAP